MKRITSFVASVALVLSLSACGPESGEVYAKDYTPAYTQTQMVPNYMTVCTGGSCRQQFLGMKKQYIYHDDCHRLSFRNDSGEEGDECVAPSEYDQYTVGDWYGTEE